MREAADEQLSVSTKVNENGRILIPAAMREQMGVRAGDAVTLTLEGDVLRIETYRAKIKKMQQEMQKYKKPGVSVTDEFIAERREEARREMEDSLG